jgi:uncharacterized protein YggE
MIRSRIAVATLATLALISDAAAARPVRAQAAAMPIPAPASSSPYDKAPWWMRESVIPQTGHVFTELPANRASVSATFLAVDTTVDKAQAKAIAQTRALQTSLAKLGKDSVRVTTGFSMRALYEQYRDKNGNRIEDERGDKITGYQVSLNISLEIRDMAVLEKAYALVLAASPAQTNPIYFSLQPSNEINTWLYNEAVKDARKRAADAAEAAGGHLGGIKVVDPTGRACQTDILARNAPDDGGEPEANEVVVTGRRAAMAPPPPPPPPPPAPAMADADALEAKALANPFIQTPPLQRLEATACVVYGLN